MLNFLSISDLSRDELEYLIKLGIDYKYCVRENILHNKLVGLLFALPSTRTRMSFLSAVNNLGGRAEYFSLADLQMKNGESIKDTAKVVSQYLDALVIRNYNMEDYGQGRLFLEEITRNASIPIINALDEKEHPTQVLADLVTLYDRWKERIKEKTILITWGYSRRQKSLGVPHSWLCAASLLGLNIRIAHPAGFELEDYFIKKSKNMSKISGAKVEYFDNLEMAVEGVDCVYVKNWKSLSMSSDEEKLFKKDIKNEWCVTSNVLKAAKSDAIYMDCLPSISGEESTEEVRYGPNSIIFEQAANRVFANQAILRNLLVGK